MQGPERISYALGYALSGILFGILFDWIWGKTKNKFIKTVVVIFTIMLVSKDLVSVQNFAKKANFKHACSKGLQVNENEAYLFFKNMLLEFKVSLQKIKEINLKQELDEIETRVNKDDVTILNYSEELANLLKLQEKIGPWIHNFEEKDVERFYYLYEYILSTLKAKSGDSSEILEAVSIFELLIDFAKGLSYSKEKVGLSKKLVELGVEKFVKHMEESSPEEKKLLKKIYSQDQIVDVLTKLVGTELFADMASELIVEVFAKSLRFVDQTEFGFDFEDYMKSRFNVLKDTPKGQKEIIEDIKKLKSKFTVLADAAIAKFCF